MNTSTQSFEFHVTAQSVAAHHLLFVFVAACCVILVALRIYKLWKLISTSGAVKREAWRAR